MAIRATSTGGGPDRNATGVPGGTTLEQDVAAQPNGQPTLPEVAGFLQELVGRSVTAVIAGVDDAATVASWTKGDGAPPNEAERRLRAAFDAARLIADAESPAAARAWLMGRSPYLNDRSPALVIADDAVEGASRVLRAAHAYLAHG